MLDIFTHGEAIRLSPEAPVPVVRRTTRRIQPGGAGNAAANLASFGDAVSIVGVIGSDNESKELVTALKSAGVVTDFLITVPGPTTSKHRVLAGSQQLVRLDVEANDQVVREAENSIIDACQNLLESSDVVLISDYGKGVCSAYVCGAVLRIATDKGLPVVVDPKGIMYRRYSGATVVTPNVAELRMAAGNDSASVEILGQAMAEELGCAVLVTRSADGMSLFQLGSPPMHLPTQAREVFDVTGAGDTVASVVAGLLARGVPLNRACAIANACAGVVVGRSGTSAIEQQEIMELWDATDRHLSVAT